MKILISSHAFAPSIGGIETVTRLLANEFVRSGHKVSLLTQTPEGDGGSFAYPVIRQPSTSQVFRAIAWSDIFWQNNLSLRTLWPTSVLRGPVAITHQGSYCRRPRGVDLQQRLKHMAVNRYASVAISEFVARCFKTKSIVIPNPYDSALFHLSAEKSERPRELIFLGRLVTEKGVDLLLQSLNQLRSRKLSPRLTIVGSGPEQATLERMTADLGLADQVTFAGAVQGLALVELLRRHRVLVIPSRYDEPFGVVALEGIACGCVIVGSNGGGLPEAIGLCGLTFPNGDLEALTERLVKVLRQPEEQEKLRANAGQHLANFQVERIAHRYLNLFQKLM